MQLDVQKAWRRRRILQEEEDCDSKVKYLIMAKRSKFHQMTHLPGAKPCLMRIAKFVIRPAGFYKKPLRLLHQLTVCEEESDEKPFSSF